MKNHLSICRAVAAYLLLLGAVAWPLSPSHAQTADKFYYWVTPFVPPAKDNGQSFVVQVDSATRDKIEAIRSRGGVPQVGGHIAAASVSYNKNYYAPGHPVWNWYFTSIDHVSDYAVDGPPDVIIPEFDHAPYE